MRFIVWMETRKQLQLCRNTEERSVFPEPTLQTLIEEIAAACLPSLNYTSPTGCCKIITRHVRAHTHTPAILAASFDPNSRCAAAHVSEVLVLKDFQYEQVSRGGGLVKSPCVNPAHLTNPHEAGRRENKYRSGLMKATSLVHARI